MYTDEKQKKLSFVRTEVCGMVVYTCVGLFRRAARFEPF